MDLPSTRPYVQSDPNSDSESIALKEYLILGTDKRDAETQRDLWLSKNPAIKIIRVHRVKQEPPTLLARIGSNHVPRVSIMVEYEDSDDDVE